MRGDRGDVAALRGGHAREEVESRVVGLDLERRSRRRAPLPRRAPARTARWRASSSRRAASGRARARAAPTASAFSFWPEAILDAGEREPGLGVVRARGGAAPRAGLGALGLSGLERGLGAPQVALAIDRLVADRGVARIVVVHHARQVARLGGERLSARGVAGALIGASQRGDDRLNARAARARLLEQRDRARRCRPRRARCARRRGSPSGRRARAASPSR